MNHEEIKTLRAIHTFPSLVKYLRDELAWPVEAGDFEELTFDWEPEELGIDADNAAKIQEIKQLRPLADNQPWGIFFIKFEPKRLPVVVLRRILSGLVIKKRASARHAEMASWNQSDLLFISNYGEGEERQITFAHFSEDQERGAMPALKVLGWDDADTVLHIDNVHQELKAKLHWPENEKDSQSWRQLWDSAFVLRHREVITTSKDLAVRLADLARRIRKRANVVLKLETERGPLRKLHSAFKEALIHDLNQDDFADMYAQTITYGLLAARVSRPMGIVADNMADMVPMTNPFLKEMLGTFLTAGGRKSKLDFDELGVQEVVDLLNSPDTHMEAVLRDFGNRTRQEDPVIHFYELFLKEYDPEKKVKRGVFNTPQPAVSYIVRSVHELLQTEFGLEDGLASIITWGEMEKRIPGLQRPLISVRNVITLKEEEIPIAEDEPFVQILDPATGTATFIVEVIDVIFKTMVAKWQKEKKNEAQIKELWNAYVPAHLLPRVYGYEIMMASYAIAHMKIGLKLHETGYNFNSNERVHVYLTNALEPPSELADERAADLFGALGHEAQAVNKVKREKRFTVVVGNPPYSGESANKGEWIRKLMEDYKKEPGGREKLKEKNPKWINDDYVKFLRYGQYIIDKNAKGILAFINPHGFLDNPTFRGMRWKLLETYDKIYTIDLHGNSKKKEVCPDGSSDINVFDIMQGVSINLFIKTGKQNANELKKVFHCDLYGMREIKYDFLFGNTINTVPHVELKNIAPNYYFVQKDFDEQKVYDKGFSVSELFNVNSVGIVTARDAFTIHESKEKVKETIQEFLLLKNEFARKRFDLGKDVRDWSIEFAKNDLIKSGPDFKNIVTITYRPFDNRFTYYTGRSKGFHCMPRGEVMRHFLNGENVGLIFKRGGIEELAPPVFISKNISESRSWSRPGMQGIESLAPLYLYPENTEQLSIDQSTERMPNLNQKIIEQITEKLGLMFAKEKNVNIYAPVDILNYIYAVLHSPSYRQKYIEFLKIDFPRVPYPKNPEYFWAMAKHGGELVALHLMESPKVKHHITKFVGKGEHEVEKISYSDNTVWVDKAQSIGFSGVPENVWNFYIGGYQVCEKWLKDRKGRMLSKEDINHYHGIVVALNETIRIMAEIDKVIEQHGGWPGAFEGKKE